ncbi:hypothetical protein Tco_0475755 [Tanacetum coccineum]
MGTSCSQRTGLLFILLSYEDMVQEEEPLIKTLFLKKENDIILVKSMISMLQEILKSLTLQMLRLLVTIEIWKPLVKDEEANDVDVHLYRSMIGSLMYLTASRPDLMFAVCACSRKSQQEVVIFLAETHFLAMQEADHVATSTTGSRIMLMLHKMLWTIKWLFLMHVEANMVDTWRSLKECLSFHEMLIFSSEVPFIMLPLRVSISQESNPLFAIIVGKPTQMRGPIHEVPIEHQPNLSPRPSPTTTIPDSIPETSGENLGGHSSSDRSLSGNEGDMTLQTEVSRRASQETSGAKRVVSQTRRMFAKGDIISSQCDPLFDEVPEVQLISLTQRMLQDEGRIRGNSG